MVSLENLRLVVILVVVIAAGFGAWRNRPHRGSKTLTAFMTALGVIVAAHLFAHLTSGFVQTLFIRVRWSGIFALPFFVLAFALAFSDRGDLLSPPGIGVVFALPAFLAGFLWLPLLARLVGVDLGTTGVTMFMDQSGPIYLLSVALGYGVLLASSGLILYYSYQIHDRLRLQGLVLAAGIGLLWIGTAIEVFEIVQGLHVHWVQNSFLVLGLAVFWAIYRGGVTDITPLARSTVFDTLDVGVLVVDDQGTITDINPAAEQLLELDDQRVVGRPRRDALGEHPELLAYLEGADSEEAALSIAGGERTISTRVTPLTDTNGREIGEVVLLYDITAQQRQREELERQNERLQEFADVVSHDLRNPLNVATARLQRAMEDRESDELAAVDEAHKRMDVLIESMLSLAKAGEAVGELEPVDVGVLGEMCWRTVEVTGGNLDVRTDLTVQGDRTRLQQLFENLLRNAVEHGGEDVTVTIGDLSDGFYVADDGPGIPEEKRDDVFEPGYTTSNDGTGLGLNIVRDIAEAHDWDVAVTESADGGARFEFTGVVTTPATD